MTRLTIVAAIGVLSVPIPLPAAAGSEPAGHRHDVERTSLLGSQAIRKSRRERSK
jgi:hypothetical protein